ncbi:COG4223 family protein [Agrobacterium sp. DKPNP3]|uniref:COG4223 family protein n=1 Tax=Agrobacterium sp. DKPNP3 TaxID=3457323 RepID=UPI004043A042
MVSGKPPRHSKSKAEPVTIDLDAKDVKAISADGDAEKADEKPEEGTPAATTGASASESKPDTADTAATASTAPLWETKKTSIEPEPNVAKPAPAAAAEQKADSASEKRKEPLSSASTAPKIDAKPEATSAAAAATAAAASKPAFGPTSSSSTAGSASAKTSSANLSSGPTKPPAPPQTERRQAATSGLIAAGIVGGLVALAAAGSMQYAGILPSANSGRAGNDEIAYLKTDIANLRQQIANAPAADSSALEQRLAALEAKGEAPQADGLAEKIAALESTLQSERSAQASVTADLTRRLSDAEAKINEPRDDIEVARAIASAGLKAAIDRGGPFLTELDTLSKVTPDDHAIASLRSFAATGVPSRSELMQKFPDVANAMLSAINQPDPNQGIMERLTESALSLVKVRPVGNIEGETPEAMIARMENKLRNGDLQGAALEWNGLPEAAKSASADYKKSLDARIEVENLVGGTLNRAITSTGKQG